MVEGEVYENKEFNKKADNLKHFEEAIPVVKEYETIIRSQKKSILKVTYKQVIVFKKFKASDKFLEMVKEIGLSKSTVYFKIKLAKILDKYPKSINELF